MGNIQQIYSTKRRKPLEIPSTGFSEGSYINHLCTPCRSKLPGNKYLD